ncbi:MAG: CS1 type fimbrial major subunit [Hafnia sp.]
MNFAMKAVAIAIMGFSLNAMAVQKDITINANVDPSLDMTLSDAQPLPTSVLMQYIPGNGLAPYAMQTKIWSNAYSDVSIKLANDVLLYDRAGSSMTVPIKVSYGGLALTTTSRTMAKDFLFPGGLPTISTGSIEQELKFTQATPGTEITEGNYTGVVGIVLTQSTTATPPAA